MNNPIFIVGRRPLEIRKLLEIFPCGLIRFSQWSNGFSKISFSSISLPNNEALQIYNFFLRKLLENFQSIFFLSMIFTKEKVPLKSTSLNSRNNFHQTVKAASGDFVYENFWIHLTAHSLCFSLFSCRLWKFWEIFHWSITWTRWPKTCLAAKENDLLSP